MHILSFRLQQFGYCSEPEFDTEYSHQHVHKNKVSIVKLLVYFLLSLNENSSGEIQL